MNTKEVLVKAKELLSSESMWGSRNCINRKGQMCLLGAVGIAAGYDISVGICPPYDQLMSDPSVIALANAITGGDDWDDTVVGHVYSYNDKEYRTFADVHAMLDLAIDSL